MTKQNAFHEAMRARFRNLYRDSLDFIAKKNNKPKTNKKEENQLVVAEAMTDVVYKR